MRYVPYAGGHSFVRKQCAQSNSRQQILHHHPGDILEPHDRIHHRRDPITDRRGGEECRFGNEMTRSGPPAPEIVVGTVPNEFVTPTSRTTSPNPICAQRWLGTCNRGLGQLVQGLKVLN